MIYREYIYDIDKSPLGISSNIWHFHNKINNIDFNKLNKFLLNLEKDLLKKEPKRDGNTGLKNSVTSRFEYYNLLKQENDEIKKLELNIINTVRCFLEYKKININKIFIQCWFNVLRQNEQIKLHRHFKLNEVDSSFISGHLHCTDNNSSTFYGNLSESNFIEVKNMVGDLILFPSYVPHFVSKNTSTKDRISIAFDIYPNKSFCDKDYLKNNIIKEICLT
jgi:hypothetical protein|tara:strand:+ start:5177 stop:5839 length:663 start_codon:yes stop_codon:yes gene_type:complete